jgi:predicted GNAT superfamily acetyltransferase
MTSEKAPSTSAAALAEAAPASLDGVIIRRVETLPEYHECLAIQEETWGSGFRELVPPAILMVAQKLGGVCAGAFASNGRMLGFVFGITGIRDGRLAHWSDMLAVRPEARGVHIGEHLKHYQRDLVRAVGVDTMYWTFDPLVARNAHLNLNRLGARAVEYVANMYGSDTGSPLHGGLATDRVVVAWDLTSALGTPQRARRSGVLVIRIAADGLPSLDQLPRAPRVRIAIPHDLEAEPNDCHEAWRAVTREAFLTYLNWGYEVVGFRRGDGNELPCYELSAKEEA